MKSGKYSEQLALDTQNTWVRSCCCSAPASLRAFLTTIKKLFLARTLEPPPSQTGSSSVSHRSHDSLSSEDPLELRRPSGGGRRHGKLPPGVDHLQREIGCARAQNQQVSHTNIHRTILKLLWRINEELSGKCLSSFGS